MLQELLKGSTSALLGDSGILEGTPCPTTANNNNTIPNNTSTTTITSSTSSPNSEGQQNLKCPRCDSTNTKFCYYNNYNLTQPRHFCKTCRRYWTKGGALRNVPIGGGCRKNKNTSVSHSIGKSTHLGKLKTFSPPTIPSDLNGGILWASPQNSHILALLRAAQNSNPACMSNSDEGGAMISHMHGTEVTNTSLWINNQNHSQHPAVTESGFHIWRGENHQQHNGFALGDDIQNYGLQNVVGNMGSVAASTSTTSIHESAPVTASDLSYSWNPAFSWSDLPTTNGAYH